MLSRTLLALLALIATPLVAVHDEAVVREQRSFTVDGLKEVWRLIWRDTPRDSRRCGPADPDLAMSCPCSGAAWAQVGDLILEREGPGTPPGRMPLTPLFAASDMLSNEMGPVAMLARSPARLRDVGHNPTPAEIRARPA